MTDEKPMLHVTILPNEDKLIGECLELPLIVEGSTDQEIEQKMFNMAKGYFEAFSDKKTEFFSKRSITIPASF